MGEDSLRDPDLVRDMEARGSVVSNQYMDKNFPKISRNHSLLASLCSECKHRLLCLIIRGEKAGEEKRYLVRFAAGWAVPA